MTDYQVPRNLAEWAATSLENGENILATSNQGTILLYQQDGYEFVVKAAMGTGAVRKARQATLVRESKAYERLQGVKGVPVCYGMVAGRFLVLEFIHGVAYREAEFADRDKWFGQLREIITAFHERGVSHGDLKSKSNLMMTNEGLPCVIDFGTTVMHKEGFHPFNNYMFSYMKQLDINAWVKHKYHGNYADASIEDQQLLDYGIIETLLRKWRKRRDQA